MAKALINKDILIWAIKRANVSVEQLAKTTGVKTESIEFWLPGKDKPTMKQAQKATKSVKPSNISPCEALCVSTKQLYNVRLYELR
ncbi:MAG: hypothetical protein QM487_10600 [Candidatus Marithrix sp.]